MLNVLKNSILIVLFVLVSSSGILAKGQNLSFNGSCLECNFCRNEICEVSTVPLLLFLHESCELTLGYSHVVPDSKSQLVPSFLQRNSKNNTATCIFTRTRLSGRPNTTSLPCEKSLFSRRSTKLQVGPIALQVAVTSSQLAVFFPCN